MQTSQSPVFAGPLLGSGSPFSAAPCNRVIDTLARKTRFVRRTPRKLSASQLLKATLAAVAEGTPELRSLAINSGIQCADTFSKQSLWERLRTPHAVAFFEACTHQAFASLLKSHGKIAALPGISRVLVGDSSAIKLHPSLNDAFPGGSNQNKQCAQLRLQCTLDLLSGQWVDGGFEPYLRQDAKAAHDLAQGSVLKEGDLVVRDLGYAVIDAFAGIAAKQAFFLSRCHPQWNVYRDDDDNGGSPQPIDLVSLLEKEAAHGGDRLRIKVRIGQRQRMACELIAVRVPEAVAATRRRRARQDAKRKGVNHTKRYMKLLGWTLMVTNVPQSSATIEQLCELYAMRWRVEMFFKLCKSHTALNTIAAHRSNRYHVELLLWAWLMLMVILSGRGVFAMTAPSIDADGDAPPDGEMRLRILRRSQFKIMARLKRYVALAIQLSAAKNIAALIRDLTVQDEYHNQYERRIDRTSLPGRLSKLILRHP